MDSDILKFCARGGGDALKINRPSGACPWWDGDPGVPARWERASPPANFWLALRANGNDMLIWLALRANGNDMLIWLARANGNDMLIWLARANGNDMLIWLALLGQRERHALSRFFI